MHHNDHTLVDLFFFGITAFIILIVSKRLKFQTMRGLLLSGVALTILGPKCLNLIDIQITIVHIAEFAVGFILLVDAIRFTLEELIKKWKLLIFGGLLQLLLTTFFGALTYYFLFEGDVKKSIFVGMLLTMSSTIAVLNMLKKRHMLYKPSGQMCIGILFFQDLSLLPSVLVAPALGGTSDHYLDWLIPLVQGISLIATIMLLEFFLIRRFLDWVAEHESRTIFNFAIALICLGTVICCWKAGLSPALGMFLAGLMISKTKHRYKVVSTAETYQETLEPIFFISIGMLLNPEVVFDLGNFPLILISSVGAILLMWITASIVVLFSGFTLRSSIRIGGALAQIGELSFILGSKGVEVNAMTQIDYDVFIAIAFFSMFFCTTTLKFALFVSNLRMISSIADFSLYSNQLNFNVDEDQTIRQNHFVVIGFGIVGKLVARQLQKLYLPVLIIESKNDLAIMADDEGFSVIHGDAKKRPILESARVDEARFVVLAFDNVESSNEVLRLLTDLAPQVFHITRTRLLKDAVKIEQNANGPAVAEELAVAFQIERQVLHHLGREPLDETEESIIAAQLMLEASQHAEQN